jgi:hypothetical protein
MTRLQLFVAYGTKGCGETLCDLDALSPHPGLPTLVCLFPPNAPSLPRSAKAGGKAAKNSISYITTKAAYFYQPHAKADKICGLP